MIYSVSLRELLFKIILPLNGGLLLAAFLWIEHRSEHPMAPLKLFKSHTFSAANMQTLMIYAALSGILFFLPLNLVQVQGYPEHAAGLAILPFALLIASMSRWAGALTDRIGARGLLIIGPLISGSGAFLLTVPDLTDGPQAYWASFFPAVAALGLGMGLTVAPLTTAVMAAVPDRSAGTASGINNTVARTAGVLAIAILGAVALVSFRAEVEARASRLQLSVETRQALQQEAAKLAEATPPSHVGAAKARQIELLIDRAFVATFDRIGWIAAALCWLSVLLSVGFIKE